MRATVAGLTSNAVAIAASVHEGPASPWLAFNRMRAWVSTLAAATPRPIMVCSQARSSSERTTMCRLRISVSCGGGISNRTSMRPHPTSHQSRLIGHYPGCEEPETACHQLSSGPTSDKRRQAVGPCGRPREKLTMEPVEPDALTPLQAARLDKGWKAAKLAAELRVSEPTLSRWEHGRQQPTLGHQQRLCEVLDMDPVELGFQEDILDVGT